jgi:hypothetical protein
MAEESGKKVVQTEQELPSYNFTEDLQEGTLSIANLKTQRGVFKHYVTSREGWLGDYVSVDRNSHLVPY